MCYVRVFVIIFVVWLIGWGGFVLFIDFYGVSGVFLIEGINVCKSCVYEDGYCIVILYEIMLIQVGIIVMGSLCIVDGFFDELFYWDGGFVNMGIFGISVFEFFCVSLFVAENENIQCVIIGIDSCEFGIDILVKVIYWLIIFDGGSCVVLLI